MKCIPFGDINAHGSIADSLTFRRVRGGVVLQSKPRPRITNSQLQIVQRQKLTDANAAWYVLNPSSKAWVIPRATQLATTPRRLFCKNFMLNNLPALSGFSGHQIVSCQVLDPTGLTVDNFGLYFDGLAQPDPNRIYLGEMDMATNTIKNNYYQQSDITSWRINAWWSVPVPYRFGAAIVLKDLQDVDHTFILRFPAGLTNQQDGDMYYVGSDGSLFSTDDFTTWLTTNLF